ncbi:hypothetical protein [Caballeronia sp. LZ035]|uniref:hypothetical protein n=1 Tax=Caballeronia sp. LZ035 TaxID=3038568 RepID=UPI002865CACD|nr:hypothetical protein [Caballeronia sp. LZ035]MDR5756415.1 hypothetical protein [Caballeronia sp. LZ035]
MAHLVTLGYQLRAQDRDEDGLAVAGCDDAIMDVGRSGYLASAGDTAWRALLSALQNVT